MKQNMTPKEKAKHLIEIFYQKSPETFGTGKAQQYGIDCALVCVDVILNEVGAKDWHIDTATKTNYWQDVKTELSLL